MVPVTPVPADVDESDPKRKILLEAIERFKACKEWQGVEDERSREDIKFANGDARNTWQWPSKVYQDRTADGQDLPCLTINKTRVHNDIIINGMSKNKYGPKVTPVGGAASYKSAEAMNTLIKRTLDISRYTAHRRKIAEQQVDGGIGYAVIETAYVSSKSFDQDIYITASRDPTGVYLDPWIRTTDGLDANFGFIFERLPRKEFNKRYPDYKDKVGLTPIDSWFADWITDKEVTLAKYFRKNQRKDTLISFKDSAGEEVEKLASEIREESGAEIYAALMDDIKEGRVDGKKRSVTNDEVEWYLIGGDVILEKGIWAGKYIPILRCVGRELVIDATLDRKGHTRPLIDAQRMLNFAASTDVQVNALQPKSPWLASARSVEGISEWKDANLNLYAVLTYNDVDDEAPVNLQQIEPPQRINPAPVNPAYQAALQNAERQLMMISGQFQAQLGESDQQSAISGKAIGERQEQAETATYHFNEHMHDMERAIGVQLLDLYPKIYDTKRALHCMGTDGERIWIHINQDMNEAVQEMKDERGDEEALSLMFNPNIGEYECVSDPGPDFATQRQEAWQAMSLILQQNMALAGVIGDLLFKYGDFPGADKIMERLQKEIKATKPYLFDENADPQITALQQQMTRLQALNTELMQKLAGRELQLRGKTELRDIEAFKAETDRMKATLDILTKTMLTPAQQIQMQHELVLRSHDAAMDMIVQANTPALQNGGEPSP